MSEREILYRGKRINDGEWVKGDLSRCVVVGQTHICRIEDNFSTTTHRIAPETVCEYTGLTDKNGRKIFQGDIVRDIFNASVVGIVRYGEYRNTFNDDEHGGHIGFYIEWQDKKEFLRKDLVYWAKNSEFIGNILDNSELIDSGGEQE